jgi:hypothetical protein
VKVTLLLNLLHLLLLLCHEVQLLWVLQVLRLLDRHFLP